MNLFKKVTHKSKTRGFTIVELIVSVFIFSMLSALLVSKYGTFNSSVLLTNLAYDVALTLRNAQTYGLNVKSKPTDSASYTTGSDYKAIAAGYQYAYGVHFEPDDTGSTDASRQMIFFADLDSSPVYQSAKKITTYELRNGSYISQVCMKMVETASGCVGNKNNVDIWFKRPEPDAHFSHPQATYAEITIKTPSGATKKVLVRKSGQIVVLQNS